MNNSVDHYKLLEISRNATKDQIRHAYKGKALQLHPDKNPLGESDFKKIVNAYQILNSPRRKHAYDRELDVRGVRSGAKGFGGLSNAFHRSSNHGHSTKRTSPLSSDRRFRQRDHANPAAAARAGTGLGSRGGGLGGASKPYANGAPGTAGEESIFRDAFEHYYKWGQNAKKWDANGGVGTEEAHASKESLPKRTSKDIDKSEKPTMSSYDGTNFAQWFKKKQAEMGEQENAMKEREAHCRALDEAEKRRMEEGRRVQLKRQKETEAELAKELKKLSTEFCGRREFEEREAKEKQKAAAVRMKNKNEEQQRQEADLERQVELLRKEKEELRKQNEEIKREKEKFLANTNSVGSSTGSRESEAQRRERQRVREKELMDEVKNAEEKLRHVQKKVEESYLQRQQEELRRKKEEEEATTLEDNRWREMLRKAAGEEEISRKEAEVERKRHFSHISQQTNKMMESIKNERKKQEEELAAMRAETDRLEAEMRAKLEALRKDKREGKAIIIDDYKL